MTARDKGYADHVAWEATRGDEIECAHESRLRQTRAHSTDWWNGWFERSDEWRDTLDLPRGEKL